MVRACRRNVVIVGDDTYVRGIGVVCCVELIKAIHCV